MSMVPPAMLTVALAGGLGIFASGCPPPPIWASSGVHPTASSTAEAMARMERDECEWRCDREQFMIFLFSMGRSEQSGRAVLRGAPARTGVPGERSWLAGVETGVPGERSWLAGVVFRESSRCSTIRACLSSTVPRTPPSLHRRRSERVDPPLLPGMRGNYLVFFNTGIKVSAGGPRPPSLLMVNSSPAGCPWQVTVIVLLVEV